MRDMEFQMFKPLCIAQSVISGNGLFTESFIAKDELILKFGGTFALNSDRYSGRYLDNTFIGINEEIMLCEDLCSSMDLSDFINHSCNPNIGMFDSITMIAIRDILAGEELVADYAFWEADCDWTLEVPCRCGFQFCRERITGMDWKYFTSQDKSFRYMSPFIKRRILRFEKGG